MLTGYPIKRFLKLLHLLLQFLKFAPHAVLGNICRIFFLDAVGY